MIVFVVSDGNFFGYTRHEPVGVCGQIIPVDIFYNTLTMKRHKLCWKRDMSCV